MPGCVLFVQTTSAAGELGPAKVQGCDEAKPERNPEEMVAKVNAGKMSAHLACWVQGREQAGFRFNVPVNAIPPR
jgi:hypothetical protein